MFKIAILGPESTGKSTLAKALADHFESPWVPEYAREYVEKLTEPYTFEDVCSIATTQIEQIKNSEKDVSSKFIFFDTELIITKVWLEYRYAKVPAFLTEWLKMNQFDIYLLCAPDLPWVFDPVREHAHDREYFFDWYKREIEQTGKPYFIIDGSGTERLTKAIEAIQNQ